MDSVKDAVDQLCGNFWSEVFSSQYILNPRPQPEKYLINRCLKPLLNFKPTLSFSEHMKDPACHSMWSKVYSDENVHMVYNYWCMENGYLDRLSFSCKAYYYFDRDWPSSENILAKALVLQDKPFFKQLLFFAIDTILFWAKDCDDVIAFSGIKDENIRKALSTFLPFTGEGETRSFTCNPKDFVGKNEIKNMLRV